MQNWSLNILKLNSNLTWFVLLDLPYVSSIHPGLHVSHVKLAYGDHFGTLPFPVDPTSPPYPIAILDRKMVRRRHVPATKLLYNHFRV